MLLKNIIPPSAVVAGGGYNVSLRGFPLNGIVISKSVAFHTSDRINVSLTTPRKPTKVLLPNMPLLLMAGIHDIEQGMSTNMQVAFNVLNAANDYTGFSLFIPLGNLRNDVNDSSLEISGIAGDAAEFSVAAVFRHVDDTDIIYAYSQTQQTQGAIGGCADLFLFSTGAGVDTPDTLDLSVVIEDDFAAGQAFGNDIYGATFALGETELVKAPLVVQIYSNPYRDVAGTVKYQISGVSAAAFTVIARTQERDRERVSRATIGNLTVMRKRLALMDAGAGKAHVRAGVGLKLTDIDKRLAAANIKT